MEKILYKFKNDYTDFEITPFENGKEKETMILHIDISRPVSKEDILEMFESYIVDFIDEKIDLDKCEFVKKEDGYTYIILAE
ncbi:hypothetical protein J2127_001094 [Methanococcus voltae]|uniref:hypothetical protein n=1 Tax=Methanococcus voltae TaxID=2188 RepID=UPI001AE769ED|nr:hypothetical protein [Methanococcus voltae]MBP2143925.1 hypothetical protein [Methanococcus voltae]